MNYPETARGRLIKVVAPPPAMVKRAKKKERKVKNPIKNPYKSRGKMRAIPKGVLMDYD